MRLVIQRVISASVTIDGRVFSAIEKGFLVLLGICSDDTKDDADWLVGKLVQLRVFNDADGKMNLSLADIKGELLVVSQFTLYADTKKGNRPSFIRAARPEAAIPLYEYFVRQCESLSATSVKTGIFGADMKVGLINDGPVTILIDSKNRE